MVPIMLGRLPPCSSPRCSGGTTRSRRRIPVLPFAKIIICLVMSFLRFCTCYIVFIAVVEVVVVVFVHHVDGEEEVLLPEDSGSQTPLASPASADAELASLPMLTLTFTKAE